MNLEERFQKDVWYVLQSIKQRMLYEPDPTGIIHYKIRLRPRIDNPDAPYPSDHGDILNKLELWGAIKQTSERDIGETDTELVTVATAFYYFKISQPRFDEIYSKHKALNDSRGGNDTLVAEDGWELVENEGSAQISHNGREVFVFPHTYANKYRYFKCLWINRGNKVTTEDLYEFESDLKHPHKRGKNWKINKAVRDTINNLKKELKAEETKIIISIDKGATLALPLKEFPL